MNEPLPTNHPMNSLGLNDRNPEMSSRPSRQQVDAQIALEFSRKVDRLKDNSIDLAIRAAEARTFMESQTEVIKAAWVDFMETSDETLKSVRQARVALGFEIRGLLADCGDIRKFFLSDSHDNEMLKVREFVEIAERLRSLKNDGTLDKLADTILKLS